MTRKTYIAGVGEREAGSARGHRRVRVVRAGLDERDHADAGDVCFACHDGCCLGPHFWNTKNTKDHKGHEGHEGKEGKEENQRPAALAFSTLLSPIFFFSWCPL